MQLLDVNILIYAHREESAEHRRYAAFVMALAAGVEPFALSEPVMTAFVRIVTNQKIFTPPSTPGDAFLFLSALVRLPNCIVLRPGPKHWSVFEQLCRQHQLRGKLVADAAHAALAIEWGCEWISADTDFARFAPPLRWRHL